MLTASHQSDLEGRRAYIYLNPEIQNVVNEHLEITQDPEFHRLLFVLDRLIKNAKIESNQTVYEIRSRIEQAIGNYQIFIAGKKVSRNEVRQILRFEDDPKLRLEAMHCYDELSRLVERDVKQMVIERNLIAQAMGYEHYGELGLLLQGLSHSQLCDWFTSIRQSTDSIYREHINRSAARLNQSSLHPQDLSYAFHRLNTFPDQYFPSQKLSEAIFWLGERINITDALSRVRFDYVDIPFQGICVTIHVPDDIRILIDPADGHSDYVTYFHEVGHAMHSSYMHQPYHIFRDEPGPFCEGMAQTLARFVEDPEFLNHFVNLPDEFVRMSKLSWGIYNIYYMRTLITQAEFEWEMYAHPQADLLEVWRAVQVENLKVPANETIAWANNIYWASYPFYLQNYLVAEMIASQTHLALQKSFGRAVHPDSGQWLKQTYWNPGGSVEWSDKIAQATGTPLSPDQLIQEMTWGHAL
ncbi:MAG: hypothetical protein A2032_03470 [Chloroflexi bacterium RBG_19FT_COMBO_49_13]|nr:MAG: hypothetical protein A2032_03470 [Chloroflexi bacterium RBG_19FT_COMBO_49_13]